MTTPANPADLIAFLHQQLENQRFRAGALKTLAHAMPAPETGAYLTETADLLLADVDAKRRILDYHAEQLAGAAYNQREGDWEHEVQYGLRLEAVEHVLKLLALPYADRPGYREEWRP